MLTVSVRLHGQTIQTLELSDLETVYWAGRNEHCQIQLKASNGISRQHFKIFFKDGLWQVEVVSRFNQIQMGAESVAGMILKDGMAFSLTPYEFLVQDPVEVAAKENLAVAAGNEYEAPQIKDPQESPGDKTVTRALEKNAQFVLLYRGPDSKSEKIFILTNDTYLIGRDPGCDIVIDDARVSRRQFKLERKNGQYFLIDNQGVNGTYVNKDKVPSKEPLYLRSGDKIVVLNHKFFYEIRDPDFENKMQQVKHLALVEPVLPPELQTPMDQGDVGLPSVDPVAMYGLQPSVSAGLPGPAHYGPQAYLPPPSAPMPTGPSVKELNLWGYKIPLTKQNKIRLGLVGLIFFIVVYSASQDEVDLDATKQVAALPADPLAKLTPEEQKQVKVQYELAKDLYHQGNYQLAKDELAKVLAKVPSYLDSEELGRFIEVGIQSAQEREQQERLKREAAEVEERIQNLVTHCRQQIKITTTSDELEECLAAAIQLNPEHELIVTVRQDVAKIEEDRKIRERDLLNKAAEAAELAKIFEEARALGEKDPLKGIQAFKDMLTLRMHDPDKLLEKAPVEIKALEKKIKGRVNAAIAAVRGLVDTGKHRDAVIALEKATLVAPNDRTLQDEIDRIVEELRKKMQVLYQEAILEENIGNIDTAKDRWRKIVEQDIPNGEYYAKAISKLKKYGGR